MDKEKKDITIKLAKTAGFCFGVKRAVNTVYEQIEKGDKLIYTYGPIIHNEEVVKDLEEKGVKVIESEEDIEKIFNEIIPNYNDLIILEIKNTDKNIIDSKNKIAEILSNNK